MIFRAIDSDGDWRFGAGKASYARFNDAIVQNLETTLKTFSTECFFNPDIGVPWFDLINERNKDYVVLKIKSYISAVYGVVGVNEVEYTFNDAREMEIKYNIDTLYEKYMRGTVNV